MAYRGEGWAEQGAGGVWAGFSRVAIENAIRAAVHASGAREGTKFVVGPIEVETKGDPNVGTYKVPITPI